MKNCFRNRKWCCVFILLLTLFCSCQVSGSLTDVAKPYLGEYECIRAEFNEQDYLEQFDFIRLTLNPDASFTLSYREPNREKQEWQGEYIYDKGTNEFVLKIDNPISYQRRVPIKDGKIVVSFPIGERIFLAEFAQN